VFPLLFEFAIRKPEKYIMSGALIAMFGAMSRAILGLSRDDEEKAREEAIKQYLDQVIVRIDFLNPQLSLANTLPPNLSPKIIADFPIAEPREIVSEELQIKPDTIDRIKTPLKEWNFFGREREKRLCITRDFLFIEMKKYTSFADLEKTFLSFIEELFIGLENFQIRRIGLRYINKIKQDGAEYFSWNNFLKGNLLSIFNVPNSEDKIKIARAFHNLELNYGECNVRFQYGMYNPDFPALIRQKLFVLDFDAYFEGLISDKDTIKRKLEFAHEKIKNLLINSC
jgi:uncharacterized protein (TIGR04255 family)